MDEEMIIGKQGMAVIGKVLSVSPIELADRIQKTEVVCGKWGRWIGVTTKDVKVKDIVVVFMPDAVVPQIEPLAFMEKHHWKVKMCRLKGCPSEVLIMPKQGLLPLSYSMIIGWDVTGELGVKKYEKDIPAELTGDTSGNFPSFISKTDEPNFQGVPEFRQALVGEMFYASEKYDGSSMTVYYANGHFGVCSRNWKKKEDYNTAIWQIVKKYNLKNLLPQYGNYAIQMELVGPGINKNPLKLSEVDVRVFDVFNIDTQTYCNMSEARTVARDCKMKSVHIIEEDITIYKDYTDEELRLMAEGVYTENPAQQREGIVIRPVITIYIDGKRLSFKVVNLKYKGR